MGSWRTRTVGVLQKTKIVTLTLSAALVLAGSSLAGVLPQIVNAAGAVTVQPLSLQGWQSQIVGGGAVAFTADNTAPLGQGALQLTTDGDNASKAGLSMNTDTKLSSISQLSYATKQISASFAGGDPAYRLTIDADGNTATTTDTATLVYEPYWQDPNHSGDAAPVVNGAWQSWNVAGGVFWVSIPAGNSVNGLVNGAGGPPFYSLSQLQTIIPNAVVTSVSTGIGSYNTNYDVEVDAFDFNGTTYNFEPTPGPVEDVTQDTYYDTIQEAVDAANPGDVIKANAGTYDENVTVNKPLTIDGANAGTPGYATRGSESTVTGSFDVTASNVTLNGFTVDPTSGSSVTMQGSYTGETVEDNVIDDNGYAVNFNTGGTNISSNQINYGTNPTSGIEANSNPGNVIHFFDNHFHGNGSAVTADITVIGGSPTRIEDVYVDKNTSTSGATLAALFNTRDATISRNISTGAQGSAIYIGGDDSYINVNDDNVISQAVTAVNVANDFNDGSNDHVAINDNQFDTSNGTGVKVEAGAYTAGTPVNATNNWWGSASGPTDKVSGDGSILDTNPNGTGSPAVGAVQYSTWCTVTDCSILSNAAPGAPTNLSAKFQYDSTSLNNGDTLNITAKPGNNLELTWSAPAGWVAGYHILVTYPNGSTGTFDQGPNTNAWLAVYDGFGQHGQGKYTYQVVAVNPNGTTASTGTFTLYYDTQSPTASFTKAPANNSFINGNFEVSGTVSDNVRLSGAFFDVRDPSDTTGNAWRAGCVSGTLVTTPDPLAGSQSATLSCTINTSSLISGHTYYVRIHAGDYAGYGSPDTAPTSVRYFTFDTSAPQQPTNLQVKYQYDATYLNNGDFVRTLTKPGPYMGDNLELTWNDANGDWVTGHHVLVTWPDGTTHTVYQGSNTNNWLVSQDGFGQHGEGKYTFQVVAVNPNGTTTSTQTFSLYYVSNIPTATFQTQPPQYVNGNFQITVIGQDTTVLDSVGADVRDASGNWAANCVNGQLLNGAILPAYSNNGSGVTVEYTCTVDTQNLVSGQTYTLRARAGFVEADGQNYGNVNSDGNWQFTYDNTAPNAPVANPAGSNYVGPQQVSLSATDTSGGSGIAAIYYTTDGTTPSSTNGTRYTAPFTISTDTTLQAVAYDNAGNESTVMTAVYGIAPVISNETTINPTTDSITLVWTTNEPATSRVIYDTVSHATLGSGPNYGYAYSTPETNDAPDEVTSHSVTITGLTPGYTYYFRTVSHGSPESVSPQITGLTQVASINGTPTYQVSFASTHSVSGNGTSNGGAGGTGSGSTGTTGQAVLGVSTTTPNNGTANNGHVKGASTTKLATTTANKNSSKFLGLGWWWLLILAILAAIGVYYSQKNKQSAN